MEARFSIIGGFALGLAAGAAGGCQIYDFQPLSPDTVAQTTQVTQVEGGWLRSNVMLVVDSSASMNKPIDPTDPSCAAPTTNCVGGICGFTGCPVCQPPCATRISELKSTMAWFLADAGTLANFGVTQLPNPKAMDACAAPGISDIIVPIADGGWSGQDNLAAMQQAATAVSVAIKAISPSGGTPTAATLQALATGAAGNGAYPPLVDPARMSFVLLLTDGEPNCNGNNPNTCNSSACQCTIYQGVAPPPNACPGTFPTCGCALPADCQQGCIDTNAVVGAITSLRQEHIHVIPVGIGPETLADAGQGTGYAPGALSAMAAAGDFQRTCPAGTDAECNVGIPPGSPLSDSCDLAGGLACDDNTTYCCNRKYYVALDGPDLAQVLAALTPLIDPLPPCAFDLQAVPANAGLILVTINGVDVPAADASGTVNWVYDAPTESDPIPVVQFEGAVCDDLKGTTPANPVTVEIRIVQEL